MAKDDPYHHSGQILGPLFAQKASGMIDKELAAPLTTTSRGLMLLGSYHFFNSQRNLGWMTAGMGARVGQIRESKEHLAELKISWLEHQFQRTARKWDH